MEVMSFRERRPPWILWKQ